MKTIQGEVTKVIQRDKNYSLILDGNFYGGFGTSPVVTGDQVEFEYEINGTFRNIKGKVQKLKVKEEQIDETTEDADIIPADKVAENAKKAYREKSIAPLRGMCVNIAKDLLIAELTAHKASAVLDKISDRIVDRAKAIFEKLAPVWGFKKEDWNYDGVR